MRLLLDTHIFLWFIMRDPSLSRNTLDQLENGTHELLLSTASMWELAIKVSTGKLQVSNNLEDFFHQQLAQNDITELPITISHVAHVAYLPLHHRDPFDRLIIAQAIVERVPILTADEAFKLYPVQIIWN